MSRYLLIILLFIVASCTPSITIEGFDKQTWINDKDGCLGNRKALVEVLIENKPTLLGKDQDQIKGLLGKPDMHEIYRRSQRFYIYSIDPAAGCENHIADKKGANLTLRYNALGKVHEVVYYK